MDIILDSNIYRNDFLLRSSDFDVILDYLLRTDSSIYIPQIVLDEIRELHKRALKERIFNFNKANNNLKLILADDSLVLDIKPFDLNEESNRYINYIKNRFNITERQIIEAKDTYFKEVTRRAVQREKPCGDDGQGFRDTIIWLTLKDYCLKSREKQITFISNNDKDFANSDKTELHDSLKKECDLLGIKINYFKSIRDFIDKHSVKIDFITEDWIWENLDIESFNEYILDFMNGKRTNSLTDLIRRKVEHDCSGYSNAIHSNTYSIQSFSVYEMVDGSYVVNITFVCEIEVEYEYYIYEYDYREEPFNYPIGRYTNFAHKYFDTEIYSSLTIRDREILEYEIEGFYM